LVAGIIFIAWANYSIKKDSKPMYHTISQRFRNENSLLLGTGKTLSNGKPNAYFYNRIQAAIFIKAERYNISL
jgi:SanA protein